MMNLFAKFLLCFVGIIVAFALFSLFTVTVFKGWYDALNLIFDLRPVQMYWIELGAFGLTFVTILALALAAALVGESEGDQS